MKLFLLALFLLSAPRSGIAQTVTKGTHSDALIFSVHHDTVALAINFGKEVEQEKRVRVLTYIDKNIFSGDNEVPTRCFVGVDVDGDGVTSTVYVSGDWYKEMSRGQHYFNLSELNDQAVKIAGVYNLLQGKY